MADRLLRLGVPGDKVTRRRRTAPSLARFDPAPHRAPRLREDGTVRLVYAGALTPTYEVDVALDALAALVAPRGPTSIALRPLRPRRRR